MITPRQARKYRAWSIALFLWFPMGLVIPAVIQGLRLLHLDFFIVLAGAAVLSGVAALFFGGMLARHVVHSTGESDERKRELVFTDLLFGLFRFPFVVFAATKPYLRGSGVSK